MMLWAAKWRVTDVGDILGEALLRGWTFHLLYPKAVLDELAGQDDYVANAPSDETLPIVPFIDSVELDIPLEWARYERRVDALLSRAHAFAFLFEGGFLWRLALLFGGPRAALWRSQVLKLSPNLVLRRVEQSYVPGYWGDVVSGLEKDILLGVCRCKYTGEERSWFPSPELLIEHRFHDGQWTLYEERFLLDRVDSLRRGENRHRPLTAEEWDTELANYLPGRLLRDSFVPLDSPAMDAVLNDARIEFGGSWNLITLGELERSLELGEEAVEG